MPQWDNVSSDKPGVVAVTGSTGFVGRAVVRELVNRGWTVRALVRDVEKAREALPLGSALERSPAGRVLPVKGDVRRIESMAELCEGCSAVVHLVGIRREAPRGVTYELMHVDATRVALEAALAAGATRFLHMSALGARPDAPSNYHRTKFQAEELVRRSELDWTIFRPSIIHGPEGEFMQMAAAWVRGEGMPGSFLPYFFAADHVTGESRPGRAQPIAVEDCARAFVEAIRNDRAVGEIYPLGGPEAYDWPDLLVAIQEIVPGASAKLKPKGLSGEFGSLLALGASRLGLGDSLPFGPDEPLMAAENNTCVTSKAQAHLGLRPRPFTESLRSYADVL